MIENEIVNKTVVGTWYVVVQLIYASCNWHPDLSVKKHDILKESNVDYIYDF